MAGKRNKLTSNGVDVIAVDWNLDRVGEEWESLQGAGQTLWSAHERNRWRLGDLGVHVVGLFKAGALKTFAFEISNGALMAPTLYDYTATSATYSEEDRAAFPSLSWSHYRQAKGRSVLVGEEVKSTIRHDIAMTWLGKAADEGWSVADLKRAMAGHDKPEASGEKPPAPKMLLSMGAQFLRSEPKDTDSDGNPTSYITYFETVEPVGLTAKRIYELQFYGVPEDDAGVDDDND